ncbi:MAG: hypothetical protein ACK5XA_07820 [Tagaea sp.]
MTRHDTIEKTLDWAAALTALGTVFDMLPAIAALFTIVWTGIRIYETDTVQRLVGRKKD